MAEAPGAGHGRVRRSVVLTVLALVLGLSTVARQAEATRVEPFVLREGPPVVKNYGPIPVVDPANAFITPANCETQPSCNVLTLEIIPPADLEDDEDFIVRIALSWDYRKVNGASTTNLDFYIYDQPPGTAAINRSLSEEPEVVTLFRPTKGKYNITVVQRQVYDPAKPRLAAPVTGYTLTGTLTREKLISPFESIAPGFEPPVDASDSGEFSGSEGALAPSLDVGPTPNPGPEEFGSFGGDVIVPLAPIFADEEFSSLARRSGQLGDILKAPTGLLATPAAHNVTPPGPVPTAIILFWAVGVPVPLVLAAYVWLRRRSPVALSP